jgi:hypothetical protein
MRTVLVSQTPLPAVDGALTSRLAALRAPLASDHKRIRVGIESAQGQLYRIVETTSLLEAVRLFEALHDLGLRPARTPAGRGLARVFRVAH